jgi:hypothetical protein
VDEPAVTDFALHIQKIGEAHKRLDVNEGRIAEAHRRLSDHDGRIGALERDNAVFAERMNTVISSLAEIKSTITWLNRLVLGGILMAAVGFVISGGLNVGQ